MKSWQTRDDRSYYPIVNCYQRLIENARVTSVRLVTRLPISCSVTRLRRASRLQSRFSLEPCKAGTGIWTLSNALPGRSLTALRFSKAGSTACRTKEATKVSNQTRRTSACLWLTAKTRKVTRGRRNAESRKEAKTM